MHHVVECEICLLHFNPLLEADGWASLIKDLSCKVPLKSADGDIPSVSMEGGAISMYEHWNLLSSSGGVEVHDPCKSCIP